MPKAIAQHFMLGFTGNLRRKTGQQVENVMLDLETVDPMQGTIAYRDLPTAIPEAVRSEIVTLSKEHQALEKRILEMVDQLHMAAEAVYDKKNEEEIAALPHCEACGQVVKKKRK